MRGAATAAPRTPGVAAFIRARRPLRRAFRTALLSSALLLLAGRASGQDATETARERGLESIRGAEAVAHVKYLADDSREGRDTGTAGERMAADYIAARFKTLGLVPVGDGGSYDQAFPLADRRTSRNLVGLVRGGDRRLAAEVVVVGAHYDHVGFGMSGSRLGGADEGQIHNGADDNASGVAALLEIAEAFAVAGPRARRSVLFVAFSGEERGLLGSRYYVAHPVVPLDRVVAMVNLDMVGGGATGSFQVHGIGGARLLEEVTRAAEAGLERRLGRDLAVQYGRSGAPAGDNLSFFEREIPVLLFHTGFHEEYHTPRDDWELINGDNLEIVARMAYLIVWRLAVEETERPVFRKE